MGYVYLIKDPSNQTYKIGVTKDLKKRLLNLQTGNSTELQLMFYYHTPYPFKLEKLLHNKFKQYQYNNEWYELPEADVMNFQLYCMEINKIIISLKDNPFFNKQFKYAK